MSDQVLVIPHIKVQNANALSSPFTIGFPAMTAWLGAVHALQRKLNRALNLEGESVVRFQGVGVVSHQFDLQTYKGPGDYEYSIVGTANPLDHTGSRPAFIEEARCHLEVSLVIQCDGIAKLQEQLVSEQLSKLLSGHMKIAGGDILNYRDPKFFRDFEQLKKYIMPGYALVERRELMIEAMQQGQDALDALIDYLAVHHRCEQIEDNGETKVAWHSQRKSTGPDGQRGWIVPIATGFQAISDPGIAKNQRDPEIPHCFAETVVTLGEFVMPYQLQSLDQLLWRYHFDAESNLYLCQQRQANTSTMLSEDGF